MLGLNVVCSYAQPFSENYIYYTHPHPFLYTERAFREIPRGFPVVDSWASTMWLEPGVVSLSVLGSFFIWTNLHLLLRLLGVASRWGWLLNSKSAYTAVVLCHAYLYYTRPLSESHADVYTDLLVWSAGFHLYHTTQIDLRSVILHHISTSTVLSYILCTGGVDTPVGDLTVFILGGSVLTEPIIYLRRALRRMRIYSGNVQKGVGWIFAVSFSVVRTAWCVRIVNYFFSPGLDLFIAGILIVIFVLSAYFSCRLMKMARDVLL